MSNFHKKLKGAFKKESLSVPDAVTEKIEHALSMIPEGARRAKVHLRHVAVYATCALLFTVFILLPNVSTVYASSLEDIPVIGDFVRVVTIRNYFYSDSNREMNITVPEIKSDGTAAELINRDVADLTQTLVDRFYEDLKESGGEGHSGIYCDYDIVTDTDDWFTLKITVHEAAGSSNTYYKYYHIDRKTGSIALLSDLAAGEELYSVINAEIKQQMKAEMAEDSDKIYWTEDNNDYGWDFTGIDGDHNFYFDSDGNIVIVFNKYEVAPGFMGTPEFTVKLSTLGDTLKEKYR